MCLSLAGALFAAIAAGVAYFQMKVRDPKNDGFFKLQQEVSEDFDLEGWAEFQRSKFARTFSFLVALLVTVLLTCTAIWQGYLAFT
jgi:hypothetical protein